MPRDDNRKVESENDNAASRTQQDDGRHPLVEADRELADSQAELATGGWSPANLGFRPLSKVSYSSSHLAHEAFLRQEFQIHLLEY
jgi:hypothetical protein